MSANPPRYSALNNYDPAKYVVSHGRVFQVSPSGPSQPSQPSQNPQQMAVPQMYGFAQTYLPAPQPTMLQPYIPTAPPMQYTQPVITAAYPPPIFSTMQPYLAPPPIYPHPQPQLLPPQAQPTYYPPALPTQSTTQQLSEIPPPPPPGYVTIPGTNYAVPKTWIREKYNAELQKFIKNTLKKMDKQDKKAMKKALRASLIALRAMLG